MRFGTLRFFFSSLLRGAFFLFVPSLMFTFLSAPVLADSGPDFDPNLRSSPATSSPRLKEQDFFILKNALESADQKDWADVKAQYERLQNPLARKILLWRRLRGDKEIEFQDMASGIETLKGWPLEKQRLRRAEELLMDTPQPPQTVLDWFKSYDPQTRYGREALARAHESLGQRDKARDYWRALWHQDSLSEAEQKAFLVQHKALLTRDDHAERARTLLWKGKKGYRALPALLPFLDPERASIAQAALGLAQNNAKAGDGAALSRFALENDAFVYHRARWLRRHDRKGEAAELLSRPPKKIYKASRGKTLWRERLRLIYWALGEGQPQLAYALAKAHGLTKGGAFAEAEWLAGWVSLVYLDNPGKAHQHFLRFESAVSTPVSLARAGYWSGRAYEALGQDEKARASFEKAAQHSTAYYGQLAAEHMGGTVLSLPHPPKPDAGDKARFEAREAVRVMHLAGDMGQTQLFLLFLYQLDDELNTPEDLALLADLAYEYALPHGAVRACKGARRQGVILSKRAYPVISLPDENLKKEDIAMTLALIRQESEFNARAVSHAGARGLMQLMPGTAKMEAKKQDMSYKYSWLTERPGYNMALGTHHIQGLLDRYDGSYALAAAAYNAGAGRVARWIEVFGDPREKGVDPVNWVERIPFSETRNYVQRVLENLQIYRHRLSKGPQPLQVRADIRGQGLPRSQILK